MPRKIVLSLCGMLLAACCPALVSAADDDTHTRASNVGEKGVAPTTVDPAPDACPHCGGDTAAQGRFAVHGQVTYIEQETNAFRAPYRGTYSLTPDSGRQTADLTLYLGARLWTGAEAWLGPELDQGFGLDNTQGLAGFPSGEAYKVGRKTPYLRLQRAYLRQTLNVGQRTQQVEGVANQMSGMISPDRWVITLGKYSVTDVFDVNQYAHDPRMDFMNWAALDAGAFDYAADAWGYTVGASVEWYHGDWTLRAGTFDLSNVPNSEHLEPGFHEFELLAEIERRHQLGEHAGKVLLTLYQNRGRMGLLDDAVAAAAVSGGPVEIAGVRAFRSRSGVSINFEQELAPGVGLFGRASKAGGNVETYEFTDIDRALQLGVSVKGQRWGRPHDTLGVVGLNNDLSAARHRYLAAGGLGVLIGDGRLPRAASERIVEGYYSLALGRAVFVSADLQRVDNPAYNPERGPVLVFAVRLHAQF